MAQAGAAHGAAGAGEPRPDETAAKDHSAGDRAVPSRPGDTDDTWLRNGRLPGGRAVDLRLRGARIAAVEPAGSAPAAAGTDLGGRWLAPAPIDSHVHLSLIHI